MGVKYDPEKCLDKQYFIHNPALRMHQTGCITRYRRIGYNLNVMRQSACLVFNQIMVDNYAAFFNCTP